MATAVVVTARGDEMIANRFGSGSYSGVSFSEPKFLGWGTGGITSLAQAQKWDIALFSESAEARVGTNSSTLVTSSQTYETTSNDTWQIIQTIQSASGQSIAEIALSDTSTKPVGYQSSPQITLASGGIQGNTTGTTGQTMNTSSTFSPGNGNYVQLNTEVLLVTAGSGSTALTVTRGQNGSTKFAANVGEAITAGNVPGGGTGVASGNIFVHASFSALPLSSGDSLQSTVKVTFN
jgi:hypothetical protein